MDVQKIKIIFEQIVKERGYQSQNKIDKVVESFKSKKGINGPNMWKVLKSVKCKKEEPATAIKNKKGEILGKP